MTQALGCPAGNLHNPISAPEIQNISNQDSIPAGFLLEKVDRKTNSKSGIYIIENILTGKKYIGSSINCYDRIKRHFMDLNNGKHHSIYLQRCWKKYSSEHFRFKIIEEVNNEELEKREQHWLNFYKSYEKDKGYNICKIAGITTGYKHTEKSRIKMSKTWKEKWNNMSEEEKILKSERLKNLRKGKINSKSHMKILFEYNRTKKKPVLQLNLEGKIIREFESATDVAKFLKIYSSAPISACCKGKRKSAYGFRWEFKHI